MKKIAIVLAALFAATTVFAQTVIKVGATPEPHADILNLIKDDLKAEGVELKVIEFTDYVTPNEAVESGEIDANYFQHIPYLESFNAERGYHLVNAAGIHVEPFALYSKNTNQSKISKRKQRLQFQMTQQTKVVHFYFCRKQDSSLWIQMLTLKKQQFRTLHQIQKN